MNHYHYALYKAYLLTYSHTSDVVSVHTTILSNWIPWVFPLWIISVVTKTSNKSFKWVRNYLCSKSKPALRVSSHQKCCFLPTYWHIWLHWNFNFNLLSLSFTTHQIWSFTFICVILHGFVERMNRGRAGNLAIICFNLNDKHYIIRLW